MMKGIGRSLNALVDKATSTLVSTSHLVHDYRGKNDSCLCKASTCSTEA